MDLTTLFVDYVDELRGGATAPDLPDSTTMVIGDQPTIRLADLDDLNTAYWLALNA
jgi:hypothetical protein